MIQMKRRISGLLMETRVSHNKQRLHKVGDFRELLASNQEIHENIRPLLRLSLEPIVRCQKTEYAWVSSLGLERPASCRITALTRRTVPSRVPRGASWLGPSTQNTEVALVRAETGLGIERATRVSTASRPVTSGAASHKYLSRSRRHGKYRSAGQLGNCVNWRDVHKAANLRSSHTSLLR